MNVKRFPSSESSFEEKHLMNLAGMDKEKKAYVTQLGRLSFSTRKIAKLADDRTK